MISGIGYVVKCPISGACHALWRLTFSTEGACSHYPRQTIKEVTASIRLDVKWIATYTFPIPLFVSHETHFLNSILTQVSVFKQSGLYFHTFYLSRKHVLRLVPFMCVSDYSVVMIHDHVNKYVFLMMFFLSNVCLNKEYFKQTAGLTLHFWVKCAPKYHIKNM